MNGGILSIEYANKEQSELFCKLNNTKKGKISDENIFFKKRQCFFLMQGEKFLKVKSKKSNIFQWKIQIKFQQHCQWYLILLNQKRHELKKHLNKNYHR